MVPRKTFSSTSSTTSRTAVSFALTILLGVASGASGRDIIACTSVYYPHVYLNDQSNVDSINIKGNKTMYPSDLSLQEFTTMYAGLDVQLITALALKGLDAGEGGANRLKVRIHSTFTSSLYDTRSKGCDLALGAYVKDSNRLTCDEKCSSQKRLQDSGQATEDNICCLEFSSVYTRSGNGVVTKMQVKTMNTGRAILDNVFTWNFVNLMSVLTIGLLVSGHLIWFVERGSNKRHFPTGYLDGVDDGLWWSIVTMTTVGYGDKAPITMLGRFIGVIWMFIGLAVFGLFSGLISSSLTADAIGATRTADPVLSIADLRDADLGRICTVDGSYSTFLKELDLGDDRIKTMKSVDDCLIAMMGDASEVQAVYYDKIGLMTLQCEDGKPRRQAASSAGGDHAAFIEDDIPLLRQFQSGVTISPILAAVNYAIAFPRESDLREMVNRDLANLEAGEIVFSNEYPSFVPGWTLESAKQTYIYSQITMSDMYSVYKVLPTHDTESIDNNPTLLILTVCLTSVYLMVQFGGLWLRRHRTEINKIFSHSYDAEQTPNQGTPSRHLSRLPSLEAFMFGNQEPLDLDPQSLGQLLFCSVTEMKRVRDEVRELVSAEKREPHSNSFRRHLAQLEVGNSSKQKFDLPPATVPWDGCPGQAGMASPAEEPPV